jgi:hypothetical protein
MYVKPLYPKPRSTWTPLDRVLVLLTIGTLIVCALLLTACSHNSSAPFHPSYSEPGKPMLYEWVQ